MPEMEGGGLGEWGRWEVFWGGGDKLCLGAKHPQRQPTLSMAVTAQVGLPVNDAQTSGNLPGWQIVRSRENWQTARRREPGLTTFHQASRESDREIATEASRPSKLI